VHSFCLEAEGQNEEEFHYQTDGAIHLEDSLLPVLHVCPPVHQEFPIEIASSINTDITILWVQPGCNTPSWFCRYPELECLKQANNLLAVRPRDWGCDPSELSTPQDY